MKILFVVLGSGFESKVAAKECRAKAGGHVSKGPDHELYGVKRTPSRHPRRGWRSGR